MTMPTWKEMGLIEQSRCERVARHLRRLLAAADEQPAPSGHARWITQDDIRITMRLLDELLPGCDFSRQREYYPPCNECHGWYWDNDCPRCHGTGLLIPESKEEGR